jgi:hypothetical protein
MDAGMRRDGDRDEKNITSPSTQLPWNSSFTARRRHWRHGRGKATARTPAAADVPGPPSRAYLRGLSGRHPISIGSLGTETTLRLCTCVYPASLPRITRISHTLKRTTSHPNTPSNARPPHAPSCSPQPLPRLWHKVITTQKREDTKDQDKPRQTNDTNDINDGVRSEAGGRSLCPGEERRGRERGRGRGRDSPSPQHCQLPS